MANSIPTLDIRISTDSLKKAQLVRDIMIEEGCKFLTIEPRDEIGFYTVRLEKMCFGSCELRALKLHFDGELLSISIFINF